MKLQFLFLDFKIFFLRIGVISSILRRFESLALNLYIYKGIVRVTMYVTSSLLNGSSDRKTEYTIGFVMVQGWFLS